MCKYKEDKNISSITMLKEVIEIEAHIPIIKTDFAPYYNDL